VCFGMPFSNAVAMKKRIVRDDEMIRESAVRCARVLRVRMADV
jgi:hypothetical protein